MANRETSGVNIEPGIVARVAAGIRYAITGEKPIWFGPLDPMQPVVPAQEQASVVGRQLDYMPGYNLRTRPRSEETTSYQQMRALADGYDLLRLVIETRKDQIAGMTFTVRPKDEKEKPDARCKKIQDFFAMPDGENSWADWSRQIIEEMLVIDAACIYPRKTLGGSLFSLDLMDGSLIKRVIDAHGRTPLPPEPAYQQILKGLPAVDYARDELIYRPRNKRVWKIYGYSPVEQIIMTVNIALRRQVSQLQFYTEGSTPDLMLSVPKEWQPDQIKQFQTWWNGMLSGNTAERRNTQFVPDGVKVVNTKEGLLKDEYDEWLARIICYAFGVEATPFVKQQNRSTSETVREQALSEGKAPVVSWLKNLIDSIIAKELNAPDLHAAWDDEESVSPLEKAQVDQIYLQEGVLHPDEVRSDLGMDPLTDERKAEINPPPPEPLNNDDPNAPLTTNNKPASAKEAFAKGKKFVAPEDKPHVVKSIAALKPVIERFFAAQAINIAQQIGDAAGLSKADEPQIGETRRTLNTDSILAGLNLDEWADDLPDEMSPYLAVVAVDSGEQAMTALDIDDKKLMSLLRERATDWAKDRAAELVGMKYNADGELVENPNAVWRIDDATRDMIRDTTTQALDEGWTTTDLADALQDSYAFSDARAETIARTELARADIEGNTIGWKASGLVSGKQWLAAPDCCDDCQDYDGDIAALDDSFEDGADVPLHPNCRCAILPVLNDETED